MLGPDTVVGEGVHLQEFTRWGALGCRVMLDCCACHVHVVLGVMPIDEIVLGSVVVVRRNEDARLPEYP